MIATLRSAGAILALAWMAHAAPPAGPPATPKSWAVAVADSIISRNPGTPRDRLAHWSYVTGYTLNGIEMVARSTGDARYWDFIQRSACEGLCVQASYDAYIHYPKAVNGNEAVAGFLWATAIVEKPAARKAK